MKNQDFDFSVNILRALLWQSNDATALTSLLQSKQTWYETNQRDFWNGWYTDVFNLDTASDFGCAVWSYILNIPLGVVVDRRNTRVFGYGSFNTNYTWGNYSQTQQVVLNLTTVQKRLALKLRYLQLVSDCSVPQINRLLEWVFGSYGTCWVLDPLDMTNAVYVFSFALPADVKFLFQFYDLLPRPATLGIQLVFTNLLQYGYGLFRQNYGHGNYVT